VTTYWRLHPADEDPESLLDPENQVSEPWDGADRGPCDKCDGSGEVEHECESCRRDGAREDCPACHGRVTYVDECPACKGTGHITDSSREGVSVFPDCEGLVRYMGRRDTELTGSVLLELEGEKSGDRDFDADEGAVLIRPRRIVSTEPVDERVARKLREKAGLES
jgi:hypothetical protein